MRRSSPVVVALCLLLSACGGSGGSAAPKPTPSYSTLPSQFGSFQFPTVSSDQPGIEPTITAHTLPPETTQMQVLHAGTGPEVKPGSFLAVDYKGQAWEPSGAQLPPFVDSYTTGDLFITSVDKVVAGWTQKLPGVKVGSRVLLIVPPKDAFGVHPPKDVGLLPNDTLMFVIDVLGTFPRNQGPTGAAVTTHDSALPSVSGTMDPTVKIPSATAPKTFEQELLVRGKGTKVTSGQWLAVQYTALVWSTGKVFDSTWTRSDGPTPIAARMALPGPLNGQPAAGSIQGVIKGLVGHTVGSRVVLVIPPDQGYGAAGLPSAGIGGTDTLVFVIDILGAYRSGVIPTASPTPAPTG